MIAVVFLIVEMRMAHYVNIENLQMTVLNPQIRIPKCEYLFPKQGFLNHNCKFKFMDSSAYRNHRHDRD